MFNPLRLISGLALIVSSLGTLFAGEMPYTDVPANAPYASSVQELYDGRIITDDGSGLFRPTELMARDFFVSLAVGIGCKECITPSVDDIIRYNISPFVDLPKVNPYYYCIAYAKQYNIAQGYIPDATGTTSCEDSQKYTSSPFCAANTITRIESAAILLRRANLWDDTLNTGNFDRSLVISDTTIYWYGYAKKAIEINIITPKPDGTIGQDEKITRGEFAIMAAQILRYTQCQPIKKKYSVPSEIIILDPIGKVVEKTIFPKGYTGALAIDTGSGSTSADWDKRWTLRNPTTGETYTGSGDTYPISELGCGTWINTVDLIDRITGRVVSSSTNTITIECGVDPMNSPLSVAISADPLRLSPGESVQFGSTINGGSGTLTYHWDFGDGSTSSSSTAPSHTYIDNGTYIVTLTVTDASGQTAISSLVIVVSGDRDTDRDGLVDPTGSGSLSRTEDTSIEIIIRDPTGREISETVFPQGYTGSLSTHTGPGADGLDKGWTLRNPTTGEIYTGSGDTYPISGLGCGTWINTADLIDRATGRVVSSASNTITIECSGERANPPLSVAISADPIYIPLGRPTQLASIVRGGSGTLRYLWDYGDSTTTQNTVIRPIHLYRETGIYTVRLTVTDIAGQRAISTLVVQVWRDGVDQCPLVYAKTSSGCPIVSTYTPDTTAESSTRDSTGKLFEKNTCLQKKQKIHGLLIGTPNCTQCPCSNTISINSSLRSCDIVFPTILSPSLDTVYSRGNFYLIP